MKGELAFLAELDRSRGHASSGRQSPGQVHWPGFCERTVLMAPTEELTGQLPCGFRRTKSAVASDAPGFPAVGPHGSSFSRSALRERYRELARDATPGDVGYYRGRRACAAEGDRMKTIFLSGAILAAAAGCSRRRSISGNRARRRSGVHSDRVAELSAAFGQEKIVAFHLAQAAIQLDPIFYDQMSEDGLDEKRLLGSLVEDSSRLPEESRAAIVSFAKLFFANGGNHNETTNRKFVPAITAQAFERAAEIARQKGARLGTRASLAALLRRLHRPLFDPDYQPSITVKNSRRRGHPHGLREQLLRGRDDERPRRRQRELSAGLPTGEGRRKPRRGGLPGRDAGRKGPAGPIRPGARRGEPRALSRGGRRPGTGARDPRARALGPDRRSERLARLQRSLDSQQSAGRFRFRLHRGLSRRARVKGSSQTLVATTDRKLDPLMKKLAANAVEFEKKAPWLEKYKKLDIRPPEGKAVETILATGDFRVTTVGDNLPNEADIREQYGTKSIFLSSSMDAFNAVSGSKVAVEFWPDPSEKEAVENRKGCGRPPDGAPRDRRPRPARSRCRTAQDVPEGVLLDARGGARGPRRVLGRLRPEARGDRRRERARRRRGDVSASRRVGLTTLNDYPPEPTPRRITTGTGC